MLAKYTWRPGFHNRNHITWCGQHGGRGGRHAQRKMRDLRPAWTMRCPSQKQTVQRDCVLFLALLTANSKTRSCSIWSRNNPTTPKHDSQDLRLLYMMWTCIYSRESRESPFPQPGQKTPEASTTGSWL